MKSAARRNDAPGLLFQQTLQIAARVALGATVAMVDISSSAYFIILSKTHSGVYIELDKLSIILEFLTSNRAE